MGKRNSDKCLGCLCLACGRNSTRKYNEDINGFEERLAKIPKKFRCMSCAYCQTKKTECQTFKSYERGPAEMKKGVTVTEDELNASREYKLLETVIGREEAMKAYRLMKQSGGGFSLAEAAGFIREWEAEIKRIKSLRIDLSRIRIKGKNE